MILDCINDQYMRNYFNGNVSSSRLFIHHKPISINSAIFKKVIIPIRTSLEYRSLSNTDTFLIQTSL